ncbi:MAG: hypothetical protein IPH72_09055 [Sandaracinaceae bacterium]|nr:hypothetical protein [Sandaracinaceae bacterium]
MAGAYPTFQRARELGDEFKGVNEHGKIQITDASRFPQKVQALNAALGSEGFLADLAYITGIPELRYDPSLAGGGIHVTGPRGRLMCTWTSTTRVAEAVPAAQPAAVPEPHVARGLGRRRQGSGTRASRAASSASPR